MAIPDRFNCPTCFEPFLNSNVGERLSDEQMRLETVQPPCNHTYHRACFVDWIQQCNDRSNSVTCPMCRGPLAVVALVPDIALVNEMIAWRTQNPIAQDEDIPPVPVVIAEPAAVAS